MKKKQINGLKKLAEVLPASKELQHFRKVVNGYELTKEQIDRAKIEIKLEEKYKVGGNYRLVDIDHVTRLKRAFARNKEKGLIDYINWVDANNKRLNKLFENANLESVSEEIMEIAKKGENGFWSNLIAFLFAFIRIFKPDLQRAS